MKYINLKITNNHFQTLRVVEKVGWKVERAKKNVESWVDTVEPPESIIFNLDKKFSAFDKHAIYRKPSGQYFFNPVDGFL